jgi:hypothetical protein
MPEKRLTGFTLKRLRRLLDLAPGDALDSVLAADEGAVHPDQTLSDLEQALQDRDDAIHCLQEIAQMGLTKRSLASEKALDWLDKHGFPRAPTPSGDG